MSRDLVDDVHADVLGSVRATTDQSGAVLARHDYFAFGEDAGPGPATGPERQRFTGKERDSETFFDYFNARYYRNVIGRFTTSDPAHANASLARPQSWNAYAYASNNPLRFVDPTGMSDEDGTTYLAASGASSMESGSFDDWATGLLEQWGQDQAAALSSSGNDAAAYSILLLMSADPSGVMLAEQQARKQAPRVTEQQAAFFKDMVPIATKMAAQLNTDANFILALSAAESGWLNAHNRELHNPFGLTKGGGNNLRFSSFEAAGEYWTSLMGKHVQGVNDVKTFVDNLKTMGKYNSVNDAWTSLVTNTYASVVARRAAWEGK